MVKAASVAKTKPSVRLYHLEELRACTELSAEETAKLLGLFLSMWRAYAEGRAVPTLEGTVRISQFFQVPISFLLSPPAKPDQE